MEDLIKALQIFLKYDNEYNPTHCEHDVLTICGNYKPDRISDADLKELDRLGFFWNAEDYCFQSYRYGSV